MKKIVTIIAVLLIGLQGFSQVIRPARVGYFSSISVLGDINITGSYFKNSLNIQPLTTLGDVMYYHTTYARLPIGTLGQVFAVSASGIPEWSTISGATPWYQIQIPNNTWSIGYDALGNSRNLLKINTQGVTEFAGDVGIGAFLTAPDAGATVLYNQSIINSPYGTVHSADFQIDDVSVMKLRGTSDGTGRFIDKSMYAVARGLYVTNEWVNQLAVTGNTEFTSAVPAKYVLEYVIFTNTTANAATLSLGTTAGGVDIFSAQVIAASKLTKIYIGLPFSESVAQSLFLNDTGGSWNSASLSVRFHIKQFME